MPRSVQNTRSYQNVRALGVYTHCSYRAVYAPTIVYGRLLKAGQFITSCQKLADECHIQPSQMRRILEGLKRDKLIDIETPRRSANHQTNEPTINGMVITVVNYGVSGNESDEEDEQNDEQDDKDPDQHPDEQTDNNKRIKNNKQKKSSSNKECAIPEGDKSLSSIAKRMAEYFTKNGFIYDGTGKGGLVGLLISIMKDGYSEKDLITAFETIKPELPRNKMKDHVAYYLTTLNSQNVYGPEGR